VVEDEVVEMGKVVKKDEVVKEEDIT